jgi:uncharacterized protein DUF998
MSAISETPAAPLATRAARAPGVLCVGGVAALATGAALIVLLQFIPPTDTISPLRRTISEYALTSNRWVFTVAVLLVALGSVVLFGIHVRQGALRALSAPTVFAALWTLSLLVIVAFPKTNWAVGPSMGGTTHRIASVIGFVCLPLGILLAARTVFPRLRGWRRAARALGGLSLAWFGVILVAIGLMVAGAGPWWVIIPLGLVERLMAFTEVLAVATLAAPLLRSTRAT